MDPLNKAVLKLAKANPDFRAALKNELRKQAGHRIGLPPYGSWKKFVDTVQSDAVEDLSSPKTAIDLKYALRELENYASHSPEQSRALKEAQDGIRWALDIHERAAHASREFDAQMMRVRHLLQQANQL